MSKRALIIHGTGGYPEENWFPWLKENLEANNYEVWVPQFPTPEGQSVAAWLAVLASRPDFLNAESTIIAHSLGGLFTLRLLEQITQPVKSVYLVAASAGVKPIKFYDADAAFAGGFSFDWAKIRSSAQHFEVFHSDDDPYVSLGNGQKLAQELEIELTFIPQAGHFNAAAGYTKFPILLEKILASDS